MSSISGYVWRRNTSVGAKHWRKYKYHAPKWHLVRIEGVVAGAGVSWEAECGYAGEPEYDQHIGTEPVDEYGVCRRCTRALEMANRQAEKAR